MSTMFNECKAAVKEVLSNCPNFSWLVIFTPIKQQGPDVFVSQNIFIDRLYIIRKDVNTFIIVICMYFNVP